MELLCIFGLREKERLHVFGLQEKELTWVFGLQLLREIFSFFSFFSVVLERYEKGAINFLPVNTPQ